MKHARRDMQPKITYNDAWESIPMAVVDDVIAFFNRELQPSHPLRAFKLFPVAKCWRRYKFLVEEEEPSDVLWVLDMDRKKRERGTASNGMTKPNKIVDRTTASTGIPDVMTITVSATSLIALLRRRSVTIGR